MFFWGGSFLWRKRIQELFSRVMRALFSPCTMLTGSLWTTAVLQYFLYGLACSSEELVQGSVWGTAAVDLLFFCIKGTHVFLRIL